MRSFAVVAVSFFILNAGCGSSSSSLAPADTKKSNPTDTSGDEIVAEERDRMNTGQLPGAEFEWTAAEVYILQLVNRLRLDPYAEATRTGQNIEGGLSPQAIALIGPAAPLALIESLTLAARAHSQSMAELNFFSHTGQDGSTPTDRAQAEGYDGFCGENIAAGQQSTEGAYGAWLQSPGHRANMMGLGINYREFGYGAANDASSNFGSYYTQLFGTHFSSGERVYLLGVVFDDRDGDEFYDENEGANYIEVQLRRGDSTQTTVTGTAGYYKLEVSQPGTYEVIFKDLLTNNTSSKSIVMGTSNVQLNEMLSEIN